MKTNSSLLRHLAAIAATSVLALTAAQAQTTATTDPVGFITLNILGGGSLSSPKLSLVSPTLTQPVSWQGLITGVSTTSGHTTITVGGVQFTNNQFNAPNGNHYVEIISTATPAHTGVLGAISATVAGTTDSSITTVDNLAGLCAIGDTIRIRKEVTLGDVFGITNVAGLLSSDDPSTADEVLVYDGGFSVAYFYYKVSQAGNDPSDGWYDSGFALSPGEAAKVVIGPHQGLVVKRRASAPKSIVFNGAVKTGNTLFPVVPGVNILGTSSAKGLTLATCGLYTGNSTTGLKSSDDPSTADEVTIFTAGGQVNYFYYKVSPAGNDPTDGWYDSGFSLAQGVADLVAIPPGTAFIVRRKSGGVAFNWVVPSPTSF